MLASFPAYPVFSVLQFPLTIIHGCGRAAKRGRPGNEARYMYIASYRAAALTRYDAKKTRD